MLRVLLKKVLPFWMRRSLRTFEKQVRRVIFLLKLTFSNVPSFVMNQGRLSYTYHDNALYGEFANPCRVEAWR